MRRPSKGLNYPEGPRNDSGILGIAKEGTVSPLDGARQDLLARRSFLGWRLRRRSQQLLADALCALGGLAVDVDDRTLSRARQNLMSRSASKASAKFQRRTCSTLRSALASFTISPIPTLRLRDWPEPRSPAGLVLVRLYGRENNVGSSVCSIR